MRAKTLYFFACFALAVAFFATVPFRGLFEPDESRYALVAQGMLQEGHWLVPHLEGRPYTHKPPLYLWLVAALRGLGLPWTVAGVLPSFAAAAALLLLFPRLGRRWGLDADESYLAAATLVACPLFATMALAARMDMLLAFALSVALAAAWSLLSGESDSPRWRWFFWLSVAAGVMSKGPVTLALLALTLVLLAVVSREPLPWRRLFAGGAWVAALGLLLAWFVPAALSQGRAWVEEILIRQSAGRMVKSFAHREPFYFHLLTWPVTGFPASLLALGAALAFWRRKEEPALRFWASAFLAILLFFSAISGKLVVYLLPLVPVGAVLSVLALRRQSRWLLWAVSLVALVGVVLGLALATLPYWRNELPLSPALSLLLGGTFAALSAFAALLAFRGRLRQAFHVLVAAGLFFTLAVLPVATDALDARLSVRPIARRLAALVGPQAPGLVYRETLSGLAVYGERPFSRLESPEALVEALQSGGAVVITQKDWQKVSPTLNLEALQIESFPYRRSALLLVYPRQALETGKEQQGP